MCGLFISSRGDLAYKTSILIDDESNYEESYADRTCGGFEELKNVVDTVTFKFLNDYYWSDKKHIYYVSYTSDGAKMCIADSIDRKTFIPMATSCYGTDKNHIYFRSTVVRGADRTTFRAYTEAEHIAFDKNNWYFYGEKMPDEDVKKMGLIK